MSGFQGLRCALNQGSRAGGSQLLARPQLVLLNVPQSSRCERNLLHLVPGFVPHTNFELQQSLFCLFVRLYLLFLQLLLHSGVPTTENAVQARVSNNTLVLTAQALNNPNPSGNLPTEKQVRLAVVPHLQVQRGGSYPACGRVLGVAQRCSAKSG